MAEISYDEMSARRKAPADTEYGNVFDICYGSSEKPIPKVYEIARSMAETDFRGWQKSNPELNLRDWCLVVGPIDPGVVPGTFRYQMGWYSVVPHG